MNFAEIVNRTEGQRKAERERQEKLEKIKHEKLRKIEAEIVGAAIIML